jgi:hypothetical protein
MSKALGVRYIPVKREAELNYRLVLRPLVQEYPHLELKHYCTWIILLFPNLMHYCTWIVLLFPNWSVMKEGVSLLWVWTSVVWFWVWGLSFKADSWTGFESPKAMEDPRFWTGPNSKQKTGNLEMQRTRFRRTGTRGWNKFLGQKKKKWEIISQKLKLLKPRTWGSVEKLEPDNTGLDHLLVTAFSYLEFVASPLLLQH